MAEESASPPSQRDLAIVAEAIHSAAIHLLRRLRREDDASGLTGPRLSALSVVVFGGPLSPGALAAAEQVRPPTMTRLVAALEADGLVAREPDPRDGRGVLIRATPAGRRMLEEGRARRTSALVRQLAALAPAELETLSEAATILERLSRQRQDIPDADAAARHSGTIPPIDARSR